MKNTARTRLLLLLGGALLLVVALFVVFSHPPPEPVAKGFYYTGPRFNHNTGQWVTEDGRIVPPPSNLTPEQVAKTRAIAASSSPLKNQ